MTTRWPDTRLLETKGVRVQRQSSQGEETLLVDLQVGDKFRFDGHDYTVAEPPQCVWGLIEVWTEELDWAFEGSELSSVYRLIG